MEPYSPEMKNSMRNLYNRLNERERRLYAGVEALKLGHGGCSYIAEVLGCSRNTVSKGACEVSGFTVHDKKIPIKSIFYTHHDRPAAKPPSFDLPEAFHSG